MVDLDLALLLDLVLDGVDRGGHGVLHEGLVRRAAPDRHGRLDQLAEALGNQLLQELGVGVLVVRDLGQLALGVLQHRAHVVVTSLEHLEEFY